MLCSGRSRVSAPLTLDLNRVDVDINFLNENGSLSSKSPASGEQNQQMALYIVVTIKSKQTPFFKCLFAENKGSL